MVSPKKILIIAPFWNIEGHLGKNRVDRFFRWFQERGYEVVIISAGVEEFQKKKSWGQEISIVDRLGLHSGMKPGPTPLLIKRRPNKWRRSLAYWLFNPDPVIVWAKAAAKHQKVIEALQGASFILSSSPPESAHVVAWMLSKRSGVPHIMDLRDGWLDEPLKSVLNSSAIRRWMERRIEARIAKDAHVIQVTSEGWKELFDARYPQYTKKVHVLTNAYPINFPESITPASNYTGKEYVLIHAGRFTGSRFTQSPELLLEELHRNISLYPSKGYIRLYGNLSSNEISRIEQFQLRFNTIGWQIEYLGCVPKEKMLKIMSSADGLLLLSASYAALPAKIFDYIFTGKPIFVVTYCNSSIAKICKRLDQCYIRFLGEAFNSIDEYCFFLNNNFNKPYEFHEQYLKRRFFSFLRKNS